MFFHLIKFFSFFGNLFSLLKSYVNFVLKKKEEVNFPHSTLSFLVSNFFYISIFIPYFYIALSIFYSNLSMKTQYIIPSSYNSVSSLCELLHVYFVAFYRSFEILFQKKTKKIFSFLFLRIFIINKKIYCAQMQQLLFGFIMLYFMFSYRFERLITPISCISKRKIV